MATAIVRFSRLAACLVATLALVSGGCPESLTGLASHAAANIGFNLDIAPTRPLSAGEPLFHIQPVFTVVDGKNASHAPTVVAFDNGDLLAAWYSYDGPHELDGAAIYSARRFAGHGSWSAPALVIDRPQADGNPVLYHEGDHVWLFQAVVRSGWSSSRIAWQESDDRGVTWNEPRNIEGPIGANVRFSPLRTASGELLLPAYDDLLNRSLFFAWEGSDWGLRSTVSTGFLFPNIQPAVVRLSDDSLLAVMRGGVDRWLWAMRSNDNGGHWTTPVNSGFPNNGASTALLRLHTGELIMAFDETGEKTSDLVATISADEGRTWLPPRILTGGQGEFRYPSMAEGPDGTIHILYSHDRQHIGHIEINRAFLIDASKTPG